MHSCRRSISKKFESMTPLEPVEIPLVRDRTRTLHVCALSGYRGGDK
jgi:hypothetical protein